MNQSFYFASNSSLELAPQIPVEDDTDLNRFIQPVRRSQSNLHPHLPIPQLESHYNTPNAPYLSSSFNHYFNPNFYVLTPNDFLSSSASVPRTGNFGGIPPMPSLELPSSGNLSPIPSSESGMSAGEGVYGYGNNSAAVDLHPADIFSGSLTVNLGASQAGSSSYYNHPVQFIDGAPVTLPVEQPSVTDLPLPQDSFSREGPERVERSTGRKMRSQATPYARPDRRASTPISPTPDVPAPISKRSKKPSSGRRKHYDFMPDARSTKLAVVCRVNSCSTKCEGKQGLMQHLKSIHGVEEEHNNKYRCLSQTPNQCAHLAGGKDALVQHMKSIHSVAITKESVPEAATERCPWDSCTQICTQSSLYRHISTHAGTTFKCPICSTPPHDTRISRLTDYQKHFKRRHLAELEAGSYRYTEEPLRLIK